MIELFEQQVRTNELHSSMGNQLKWKNNEVWYKADYTGYEGLTEFVVSNLLKYSTLSQNEFVLYDIEEIRYGDQIFNGVKSKNFLNDDWQIITLERLFKLEKGISLHQSIWKINNVESRLKFLVDQVIQLTGLKNFGIYISKLITIDALIFNEDRHMHNIAVLMNGDGNYKLCPIFDNGAGLLSDTTLDYPLNQDVYTLMKKVKAKTFSTDFDEQLEAVENLYGNNICFSFNKKDVDKILEHAKIYDVQIIERVRDILYNQTRKYQCLFKK